MMDKKVKVRLIVDVEYDANGVPPRVLRDMLEYIPQMAASNGLMTGDTEAHVATWEARTVEVLDMPSGLKDWLLDAVEDGTIDLDADAVIRYGQKEPAELVQEWHERMIATAAVSIGDEIEMAPGATAALAVKLQETFDKVVAVANLDRAIKGGAEQMALFLLERRRGDLLKGVLPDETFEEIAEHYPDWGLGPNVDGGQQ